MKNKNIVGNALWIIGCRIVQSVLALVVSMLTARYLGPSDFGAINYAASLVAFLVPLTNLGINNILVYELVKCPEEEGQILGTSIILTIVSSVFCIAGLIIFVSIANRGEKETLIVCTLYSLVLTAQSIDLIRYWFQAKLLSKYSSVSTLIAYMIVAIYKIWLLITGKTVYWFAIANALDYILIAVLLYVIYKRKKGQRFRFSIKIASRLLKQSWHYIIPGMMGAVLAQSDRVMLKSLSGNEAVGLYSAAYTIAGMSSFVFSAIIDSMRPEILAYKKSNIYRYRESISVLFGIVIYLSLAQGIFITIFAKWIVTILYGQAYIKAVFTLQIVVWYTSFSYFGGVRSVWLLAEEKQKYLWIISLVGMMVNIALNYIMIPLYGIEGAAVATLITQFFSNVIMNCFIKQYKEVNHLAYEGMNIKKFLMRNSI